MATLFASVRCAFRFRSCVVGGYRNARIPADMDGPLQRGGSIVGTPQHYLLTRCMMFEFDLPDAAEINNFAETNGNLPAGKYHVVLDGAAPETAKESGNTGTLLTWRVIGGPCMGMTVKDTIWDSDNPKAINRKVLFALRLGAVVQEGTKLKKAEGKNSFGDCLGKDVVVEVVHEEYTNKKGAKGTSVKVAFGGIWATDDPKVKSVIKGPTGGASKTKKVVTTGQ